MSNTGASIQGYLNSLSSLPGSILYRDQLWWKALPPGDQGQILTLDQNLTPSWAWVPNYYPALQQFNGSNTSYQRAGQNFSNTPWTTVFRWRLTPQSVQRFIQVVSYATGAFMTAVVTSAGKLQVSCNNNLNAAIMRLQSINRVDDSTPHYCFLKYSNTAGTAEFIIDGENADDLSFGSRVLTTGTMFSGASVNVWIGRAASSANPWPDQLGAMGFRHGYSPVWTSFMYPNGAPKKLNISSWSEWGGQPLWWHESGALQNNRGSFGAFTNNNGIQIALPEYWSL